MSFFESFQGGKGIAYSGYPLLDSSNGAVPLDGLLLSKTHQPVIFLFHTGTSLASREIIEEEQNAIFSTLFARLVKHSALRDKRSLQFELEVITFAPFISEIPADLSDLVVNDSTLPVFLAAKETVLFTAKPSLFESLTSVIQAFEKRITPNRKVPPEESKKFARHLAFIDSQTSQLDIHQNRAIVETTDGPQRIRGLAGSGKTVVLASKAAYLHASDPELDIVLTFYTKSLYGFLTEQVEKYFQLYTNSLEKPNPEKLRIMHAWGNKSLPGVYRETVNKYGQKFYDWSEASTQFGFDNAFKGICDTLNKSIDGSIGLADVIIIDEAQDMPRSFFEIVYKITRPPKRIVWAYDELQKLDSVETVPPAQILFGNNAKGEARVHLTDPNQDIVLPICYRNPKELLTTAHAFGFGIYRQEGLIQMIEDNSLWKDIGYSLTDGECIAGSEVRLQRSKTSSPTFMSAHGEFSAPIEIKAFPDDPTQAEWIAYKVKHLIEVEGLRHTDILIIHPEPQTAKSAFKPLQRALMKANIESHVTGSTFSDEFFIDGSVCLTQIFRAKGNEAAYVFLIDAQICAAGSELIKRRNTLFTAITRSRAWVAICGHGDGMAALSAEFEQVKKENYSLKFIWPSQEALLRMRRLHRELTTEDKQVRKTADKGATELLAALASGRIDKEDLDPEILEKLRQQLL